MKMLNNLVAITPDKPVEKTESGIFLTSNSVKEWPPTGVVIDIDPSIKTIKKGDKVVYSVYAFVDLNEDTVVGPLDAVMAIL